MVARPPVRWSRSSGRTGGAACDAYSVDRASTWSLGPLFGGHGHQGGRAVLLAMLTLSIGHQHWSQPSRPGVSVAAGASLAAGAAVVATDSAGASSWRAARVGRSARLPRVGRSPPREGRPRPGAAARA